MWRVVCIICEALFAMFPLIIYIVVLLTSLDNNSQPPYFIYRDDNNPALVDHVSYLLYCVLFIVFTTLVLKRRDIQPIKARNMPMLMVTNISAFLLRTWVYVAGYLESGSVRCTINRWVVDILYPAIILPYLIRAARLFFLFQIVQDPVYSAAPSVAGSQPQTPVRRNRMAPNEQGPSGDSSNPATPYHPDASWRSDVPFSPVSEVSILWIDNQQRPPLQHHTSAGALSSGGSDQPTLQHHASAGALPSGDQPPWTSPPPSLPCGVGVTTPFFTPPRPPFSNNLPPSGKRSYGDRGGAFNDATNIYKGIRDGPEEQWRENSLLHTPSRVSVHSSSHTSFVGNAKDYSDIVLLRWLLFSLVPFVCYTIVDQLIPGELTPSLIGCKALIGQSHFEAELLLSLLFHTIEFLVLLVALLLVRRVWDDFDMRGEIVAVMVADALVSAVQVLTLTFHPRGSKSSAIYLTSARCYISFVASIIVPVLSSFDSDTVGGYALLSQSRTRGDQFRDVLYSEQGFEAFRRFLFSEDASDLLNFHVRITLLNDVVSNVQRFNDACAVYEAFFTDTSSTIVYDHSVLVVNTVPLRLVVKVKGALERFHQTGDDHDLDAVFVALHDAHAHVLSVLRNAYFPFFLKSHFFWRYAQTLDQSARLGASLRQSAMI